MYLNMLKIILLLAPAFISSNPAFAKCKVDQVSSNGICDDCGVTFFKNNVFKIIGGVDVEMSSWPAQALLLIAFDGKDILCGGSLIKRNYILTAAHCIYYSSSNPADYTVYLGVQDRTKLKTDLNVVRKTVKQVIINPNFDNYSMNSDIALIELSSSVTLNKRIQLACLPTVGQSASYPPPTSNAWIVGWGLTDKNNLPNILQNVKINVYDGSKSNECMNARFMYDYENMDWSKQFCAGIYSGGKDSCQGDSGGPLYIQDKVGGKVKYVLAGIISYGYGCAESGFPGIYTRVSEFYNWIQLNTVK